MREKGLVRAGQGATAEDDRADGAGRLLIRDMDVTALRFPFDGHFRKRWKPHTGADHAEQTTELAAFRK